MNTPAHIIASAIVLRVDRHPERMWPAIVGGILPDAPMFVFYAMQKLVYATPESIVWEKLYFQANWQAFFDVFNSVPIAISLLGFAVWWSWDWLRWLSLSMLLHCACDLPLHHDDGHRHFFPFSNWRFESPVSYWDFEHFGWIAAPVEFGLLVLGAVFLLLPQNPSRVRWLGGSALAITLAFFVFAFIVWIGA